MIDNAQMPSRDSARKKRSAVRRVLSLASVFDAISAVAAPHMYSLVHFTPDLLVATSTTMSPATALEHGGKCIDESRLSRGRTFAAASP